MNPGTPQHASRAQFSLLSALLVFNCVACQPKAQDAVATKVDTAKLQAHLETLRKGLRFVEGGSFQMGDFGHLVTPEGLPHSPWLDNKPLHKVTLDSFSIMSKKITFEDHDLYSEATGQPKVGMDETSVEFIRRPKVAASLTWYQARAYCQWLGAQLKLPMDLPTEAQWEYAARNRGEFWVVATDNGKPDIGRNVWSYKQRVDFADEIGLTPGAPSLVLGHFPPNPLGLYDMMTEGQEWVLDWYAPDYYAKSPEKNPQGPESGTHKVLRSSQSGSGENLVMGDGLMMSRRKELPDPAKDDAGNKNPGWGTTSRCVVNQTASVEASR